MQSQSDGAKELPDLPTLAERVRWVRTERRRMTQEEFAKAANISRDALAKIETGKTLRPREIQRIAEAGGVSPAWLQFGAAYIDQLSEDVIEAALVLEKMPEPERGVWIKTLLRNR